MTSSKPDVERDVGAGEYEIGCAYYKMGLAAELGVASPSGMPNQPVPVVIIETWFYQGYFKLDWDSTDCDVPHYFHVFQPFVPFANTLDRPPEQGLRIPSLRGSKLSILAVDELLTALSQITAVGHE